MLAATATSDSATARAAVDPITNGRRRHIALPATGVSVGDNVLLGAGSARVSDR